MDTKTVLWVSRHRMDCAQRADLERVMGGPVRLIPWLETVRNAEELLPALREADAAAVVLPLEILAQLLPLAGETPVLQAVSGRLATGRMTTSPNGTPEPEFAFVHKGWMRIRRLELETEML